MQLATRQSVHLYMLNRPTVDLRSEFLVCGTAAISKDFQLSNSNVLGPQCRLYIKPGFLLQPVCNFMYKSTISAVTESGDNHDKAPNSNNCVQIYGMRGAFSFEMIDRV